MTDNDHICRFQSVGVQVICHLATIAELMNLFGSKVHGPNILSKDVHRVDCKNIVLKLNTNTTSIRINLVTSGFRIDLLI